MELKIVAVNMNTINNPTHSVTLPRFWRRCVYLCMYIRRKSVTYTMLSCANMTRCKQRGGHWHLIVERVYHIGMTWSLPQRMNQILNRYNELPDCLRMKTESSSNEVLRMYPNRGVYIFSSKKKKFTAPALIWNAVE